LLTISCKKEKENYLSPRNNSSDTIIDNKIVDTNKITYLALGDSYTIGASVSEQERFPMQLSAMLRADRISILAPEIIATSGWTTGELINALNNNPPKKKYSFVTLLIGVNNQYQGRLLEEYKTQFAELLTMAISYADNIKSHVFVLSIPDYSVTPFALWRDTLKIAQEIDQFNEANRIISMNFGVHYIDITPISREAKNDPSLIASDGLHPSAKQYYRWDQLLEPLVVKEIQ
jgi:lysophospholipase L1-like esterase